MLTIRYYQIFTLSQSQIGKLGRTRQDSQHDFHGAALRLGHRCISCLECFGQKGSLGFGKFRVACLVAKVLRFYGFYGFTISKIVSIPCNSSSPAFAGAGSSWQDFALREVGMLKLRWSPVQGTSLCHFRFLNVRV